MMEEIDRRSLAEQIKDALVERITTGVLRPGDRLVELKIAQEMGTSQAPVREALRELVALGLIEMRRNRGALVREVDLGELRRIYGARAALEGHAALAAARIVERDPDALAPLAALCDGMETALAKSDRTGFADLNGAFHRWIMEAAENPVLLEMWMRLDIRARTAINVSRPERSLAQAQQDHRQIVALLGAGEGPRARDALITHIEQAVAADQDP